MEGAEVFNLKWGNFKQKRTPAHHGLKFSAMTVAEAVLGD